MWNYFSAISLRKFTENSQSNKLKPCLLIEILFFTHRNLKIKALMFTVDFARSQFVKSFKKSSKSCLIFINE